MLDALLNSSPSWLTVVVSGILILPALLWSWGVIGVMMTALYQPVERALAHAIPLLLVCLISGGMFYFKGLVWLGLIDILVTAVIAAALIGRVSLGSFKATFTHYVAMKAFLQQKAEEMEQQNRRNKQ